MNPLQDMRWKTINKICLENNLERLDVKNGNLCKKAICWRVKDKNFNINEFYHTFGTPGIWFHGYLPIKEFASSKYITESPNEEFAYFDFEILNMEHFYYTLEYMKRVKFNNNTEKIEMR